MIWEHKKSDVVQPMNIKDSLYILNRFITRFKIKSIERSIEWTDCTSFDQDWIWGFMKHQIEALIHLIYMQEGSNSPLFGPWSFNIKAINFV